MTAYDAVIFDSDGVLVRPPTDDVQAEATTAAFEAMGIETVDRAIVDELCDGVPAERVRELCRRYDLEPEPFWTAWEDHDERSQFRRFRDGTRGPYDDLEAVEQLEQPCGIVSNNHHTTIEFVLEYFDLEHLFETYYGREKTLESLALQKPNGHYLERALADLDVEAGRALYVGDSECDVLAAHRTGMDSAFVRRDHCRDVVLSEAATYDVAGLDAIPQIVR